MPEQQTELLFNLIGRLYVDSFLLSNQTIELKKEIESLKKLLSSLGTKNGTE